MDDETKEKLETEKVAKREKAVAQQNKVDAKKKATFTVDSTGLKSKKYPMAAACLQGGILAGLGEATVSMIKGTPQDGEQVATCAVFGFLVAQLLVRYLAFVNKTKLVKKNKMLDSFAKVVVDQLSMAPVLTVLSLVYFKLAQEGMGADVVAHVQENFTTRYEQAAFFSSAMAFANFYLVPASTQLLVLNLTSLAWSVIAVLV